MTGGLLLSIVGIGLLDSINPSLFIAQLYLLTTRRPVPRVLSYIAGGVLAYFVGGILILIGARTVIVGWLSQASPTLLYGLQLAVGLVILGVGLWLKPQAQPQEQRKPRSLTLTASFMLGIVVIGNEVTTALPYFVAIEQIAQAKMPMPHNVLALLLYNAVFSLPLFAFLLIYLLFRRQWGGIIERINQSIQRWMPHIMKWLAIVFGFGLVLNAAGFLLTGAALFG
ncbi:MAG TPA: GAP family protein [Aggregatilineales bacterium]|nr:GAP family protein [Anaerolineales bacterium]HRE47386.1 GAP family protein [Aggregatilineales bacterium]